MLSMFVLFGGLLIFILIGVPVGYSIGLASIVTFIFFSDIPLTIIAQNCFTGLNSFALLAIPFFMLAGVIMSEGGIAKRLVNLADALIGHVSGGLGMVSVLTATFFGTCTGSGNATTSAVGSLLIPSMSDKAYPKNFSGTLIAAAGIIGIVLPPSISFVIYGVTTQTSIAALFIAGIIPGLMIAFVLMIACYIICKIKGYKGNDSRPQLKRVLLALKDGIWAMLAPVIILGGIYSGIFTPTESAVIAVVYAIIVGAFIYRELTWKKFLMSLYNAAILNGVTSFIIGFSTAMAKFLTLERIPQKICEAILNVSDNKIVVLLLVNVMLLLLGMVIDIIPALIILSPILLPVVTSFGMSPVQFGVIMVVNLGIGFITPPYGSTLFISAAITKEPVETMFKYGLLFSAVIFIVLMLITYVPWFSLFLVSTM